MAGFRKYEDMKKAELVEMCQLFGIEVHAKDTKQILIDKLSSRETASEELPARKRSSGRTGSSRRGQGRRRPTADERANATRKRELKEQTEEIMDSYADRPIDDLKPRVVKNSRKVHMLDNSDGTANPALERIDRELAASMVDPYHTLKGTMEGPKNTEVRVINGEKIFFANYVVSYGPYSILIPSFKFWDDWDDLEAHPPERLYEQGIEMIGAEVEFNMFRRLPGVSTEIYGTRIYANRIQRCEAWYAKNPDGSWDIDEGAIVEARIMRTRPYELVIEHKGAEARVPIKELSYFFIKRIDRKKYRPGKTIKVRVSNIQRAEVPTNTSRFDFPVTFDASVKDAYKNPMIVYFDDYDVGDVRSAVVTNIKRYEEEEKNGKVLYYCNIKDQVVVAADLGPGVGKRYVPDIGSEVKVRIVDKNREKHSFYGLIINVYEKDYDDEEFAILDI